MIDFGAIDSNEKLESEPKFDQPLLHQGTSIQSKIADIESIYLHSHIKSFIDLEAKRMFTILELRTLSIFE